MDEQRAFATLHRFEEIDAPQRDLQNRFPADASRRYDRMHKADANNVVLEKQRRRDEWGPRCSYNPWAPHDFAVCLTHDVDKLPNMKAIKYITQAENGLGNSTWFFMATNPYPVTLRTVNTAADWLAAHGHEIGFHPDIGSHTNPYAMEREAAVFRLVYPQVRCIRQHGLAFEVPTTWRLHERFGFTYDSTLGFAAREGFRAGYSLPYRPFDPTTRRFLSIVEVPLVVMDVTLKYYRKYTPDAAVASVEALLDETARTHGVFVLLWHNTFIPEEGYQWVAAYHRILAAIEKRKPYIGTIPDVVERFTERGGDLCPLSWTEQNLSGSSEKQELRAATYSILKSH